MLGNCSGLCGCRCRSNRSAVAENQAAVDRLRAHGFERIGNDRIEPLCEKFGLGALIEPISRLQCEANNEMVGHATGRHGRDKVWRWLQFERQARARPVEFAPRRRRRPGAEVGDSRRHDHDIAHRPELLQKCEEVIGRLKPYHDGLRTVGCESFRGEGWRRSIDRPQQKCGRPISGDGGMGQGHAHAAAGSVADIAHGVDGLSRRSGRDQHARPPAALRRRCVAQGGGFASFRHRQGGSPCVSAGKHDTRWLDEERGRRPRGDGC
jgi:hypothetical protein